MTPGGSAGLHGLAVALSCGCDSIVMRRQHVEPGSVTLPWDASRSRTDYDRGGDRQSDGRRVGPLRSGPLASARSCRRPEDAPPSAVRAEAWASAVKGVVCTHGGQAAEDPRPGRTRAVLRFRSERLDRRVERLEQVMSACRLTTIVEGGVTEPPLDGSAASCQVSSPVAHLRASTMHTATTVPTHRPARTVARASIAAVRTRVFIGHADVGSDEMPRPPSSTASRSSSARSRAAIC